MLEDERLALQAMQTTDTELEVKESTSVSGAQAAGVAALALATAACGGGESGGSGGPGTGGGAPDPTALKPDTDAQAARFLLHASLSATTSEIAAVRSLGYEPWLDRQINLGVGETAARFFSSRNLNRVDDDEIYFSRTPANQMLWSQILSGEATVRKRVALALSEFFVISMKGIDGLIWPSQSVGDYWDRLNANAFGNFRDLLEEITLAPTMGVFLNTLGNQKADPETGRVPDENFGREVMQLFSIGLYELNTNGTVRTNGSGQPIETYTNDDVTGIAKVFTGYDLDFTNVTLHPNPSGSEWQIAGHTVTSQPMTADASRWRWSRNKDYHSSEEKSFLGLTIPAGTNASDSLRMTLDHLFNHRNVGPFFAKQMIQRLVTSNPSNAYVRRVAEVFNNDGSGQRGNLRAVFKAILLDDEVLGDAGLDDWRQGKLREPMLRYAQWGRTFGARSQSGAWDIGDMSNMPYGIGQAPFQSPSVFNFFRPGYVPANSQAASSDLVAPEFQIVNESTVAMYVNFMRGVIDGGSWWARDIKADYADEIPLAHDSQALLDHLDLTLTAKQLSDDTRTIIKDALDAQAVTQDSAQEDKLKRIHIAVLLVMASNDYLAQR